MGKCECWRRICEEPLKRAAQGRLSLPSSVSLGLWSPWITGALLALTYVSCPCKKSSLTLAEPVGYETRQPWACSQWKALLVVVPSSVYVGIHTPIPGRPFPGDAWEHPSAKLGPPCSITGRSQRYPLGHALQVLSAWFPFFLYGFPAARLHRGCAGVRPDPADMLRGCACPAH